MRIASEYRDRAPDELSQICAEQCKARCCRAPGTIMLRPEEACRFRAKGTKLFQDDYSPFVVLSEQEGRRCPFLGEDNRCTDYENRPEACRAFPDVPRFDNCPLSGWKRKPKIVLASVHGKHIPFDFLKARDAVAGDMMMEGIYAGFVAGSSVRVDQNRNDCIEGFLGSDADAILFIDDDMQFPPNLAKRLWEANKPVVCGLYFQRRKEPYPHAYKFIGHGPGTYGQEGDIFTDLRLEIYEALKHLPAVDTPIANEKPGPYMDVDAGGTGCMMVRREVLEKMPPPWFRDEGSTNGDMMFFKKVRDLGYSVTMDLGCICSHYSWQSLGLGTFLRACYAGLPGPEINSKDYWDQQHREEYGTLRHYARFGEMLTVILRPLGNITLADFGCGRTTYHEAIHKLGTVSIVGIDQALSAIEDNQRRLPGHKWVVGNVLAAPLEDNSVDVAMCNSVVEHMIEPRKLLDEMWRVVKPGGLMIVGVPLELPHPEHTMVYDWDGVMRMMSRYSLPVYSYPIWATEDGGRAIAVVGKPA